MMQAPFDSDIAILGAGPGGLAAAIELGKKEIHCLLIDGSKFPRTKICGDGLSGKAISLLNKIDPDIVAELSLKPFITPSYAVRFYSPRPKMVEVGFDSAKSSSSPGFTCQRQHFDQFLSDRISSLDSVCFKPGTVITSIRRIDGGFYLEDQLGKTKIKTRLLLMATGSDRRVIKSVVPEYPGIQKEGIGARAYFQNVGGLDEKHAIEIHFLKELLPWYLWIFPFKDGSANVGLALPMPQANKQAMSLKQLLPFLIMKYPHLRERFAQATMTGKIEAHRLPYFTGRQSISGDNYMLLGDAAHLIDPFTGEGISHAMISGHLAAQIAEKALHKGDFSATMTYGYQRKVYEKLGSELELGLKLQELARNPYLLNLVIGRASRNEKVKKLLEEMLYSMNTKGKLNQPLFYLKLMLGI